MELLATRMVAGGAALAKADDGRVVLVDGALPDETVRVAITSDRSDHLRAHVTGVLDPSPHRIAPPCEYARAGCGGCTWQHIAPAAQPALKVDIVRDALLRIGRVENPPMADAVALPATGYRTTVRALVTDGRAAFRRHQSHDPITVDSCLVAHPLVDEIIRDGRFGDADEVTIRVGAATGERCVLPDPAKTPVRVPADVRTGREARVHEVVLGQKLRVSARSFFQARVDGAEALATLVRDAVGPYQRVADLYSGVGLFAATLNEPNHVIAVEQNRFAVADAQHNLHGLPARVLQCDVDRWRPDGVEVVIADPSRRGLGKTAVNVINRTDADRVVLVSCDAAALARDVALLDAKGFDLRSVTLVDLFPQTPHIECVSVLER